MGLNFTQESQGMPYMPYQQNNGVLEALLASSIFNRKDKNSKGWKDIPGKTVEAMNAANLRKDVAEVGTEVHKLGNEVAALFNANTKDRADFSRLVFKEFCDTNKNIADVARDLDNSICDVEKEVMSSRHLLSREGLENAIRIKDEIVERSINLKDQISTLHHHMDREFCHTNSEIQKSKQDILTQLAADKLDEKNDEIARLRAKHDHLSQQIMFGSQLTAIHSQIADLSQTQKLTNQVIQFGAGNLAGQAATNNQVR